MKNHLKFPLIPLPIREAVPATGDDMDDYEWVSINSTSHKGSGGLLVSHERYFVFYVSINSTSHKGSGLTGGLDGLDESLYIVSINSTSHKGSGFEQRFETIKIFIRFPLIPLPIREAVGSEEDCWNYLTCFH